MSGSAVRKMPPAGPPEYPVSTEARERIDSAVAHDTQFKLRQILSGGGYSPQEIDVVVEAVAVALKNGEPLTVEWLWKQLAQRLPRENAEKIARELAPA
jgi:hypothetical protein